VALLVAMAALTLLGAIALALHAVALRERRVARRATLARAATDAAEATLATWQTALAAGGRVAATSVGDPPGTVRTLEGGAGDDEVPRVASGAAMPVVRTRATLVALAAETRLLVAEARAASGALQARRRVALLLLPDSLVTPPAAGDSGAVPLVRRRWAREPVRAWVELP
jgi:hypothetical protein